MSRDNFFQYLYSIKPLLKINVLKNTLFLRVYIFQQTIQQLFSKAILQISSLSRDTLIKSNNQRSEGQCFSLPNDGYGTNNPNLLLQ